MKTFAHILLPCCACAALSIAVAYGQDDTAAVELPVAAPQRVEVPAVVVPVIEEPEFVGEALMLLPDNSVMPLEKTTVQTTTKLTASAYIVGIGKARTRIAIPGTAAAVRMIQNGEHKLIVKAVDNNTDPLRIISIFRFDIKGKNRQAELASTSTFGGSKSNNMEYLPFKAKKLGASSYIITLEATPKGEYGILVRNPNNVDESTVVVSTFGID